MEAKDVATIVMGAVTLTILFVNLVITLIDKLQKKK